MSKPSLQNAIVVGAGIGGLAAAKAVAPFAARVTILDRDALPEASAARPGTPQSRHAHTLLAGGQKALETLFPGLERDLLRAGATVVNVGRELSWETPGHDPMPARDIGIDMICLSRPLLEFVCRRRLAAEPNVEIRPRARVVELVASSGRDGLTGARYQPAAGGSETLSGDLVIDASGRAAPTLTLLDRLGWPKPDETKIGVDIAYATAIFEVPDDAPAWKAVAYLDSPVDFRRGSVLPIEGGRWIVSVSGRHGDDPPADLDGFLAFARSFRTPTIHDAIARAKLVGEIARYTLPASTRLHFERLPRMPRALVPLGDSICRFNPVFGQGMSVAAQEAVDLGALLESRRDRSDPLQGLAEAFATATQARLESPWATAVTDFVHPQTRGDRPEDLMQALRYTAALIDLAAEDPDVHRTLTEVSTLLKPHGALKEPALANRVLALMAATA